MGTTITVSETLCLVISGDLGAVQINTEDGISASDPSIPIGDVNDVTCENCFAYVGAQMSIGFVCNVKITGSATDGVTTEDACTIEFTTSGATKFNMDFNINAPSFSLPKPEVQSVLVAPPSTPVSLMQDPSTGIYITASPAINYEFYGEVQGTGSMDITTAFSTNAGFDMTASIDGFTTSGDLEAFAGAKLYSPAVTSNMKFTNPMQMNLNIIPTVTWTIGIGCGSGIPGFLAVECVTADDILNKGDETGIGMNMVIVTPFTAAYSWNQVDGASAGASSVATSTLLLSTQASLTTVAVLVEYSFDPDNQCNGASWTDLGRGCAYYNFMSSPYETDVVSISTSEGTQSLETSSSAGGSDDDDNSGNAASVSSKLSSGGIAGLVVGVVIGVGLIGFLVFKYALPKMSMESSADENDKKYHNFNEENPLHTSIKPVENN